MNIDALDQPAQDAECLVTQSRVFKRRLKLGNFAAIELGQVGMQSRGGESFTRNLSFENRFSLLQVVELLLEPRRAQPVGDGVNEAVEPLGRLGELPALPVDGHLLCTLLAVYLRGELGD